MGTETSGQRSAAVKMITFPLPVELRDEKVARPFCQWCGAELSNRRRRYCDEDHEKLWVQNILLREAFWFQRKKALERDKYACRHCGVTAKKGLHVHHIVPRSQGGSNYVDNLMTLCKECHIEIHTEMRTKAQRKVSGRE